MKRNEARGEKDRQPMSVGLTWRGVVGGKGHGQEHGQRDRERVARGGLGRHLTAGGGATRRERRTAHRAILKA